MKKNIFKLSPAGKLTVLLSLILTPATTVYAIGIEAAGDSAHRPEISSTITDVPLINIVAPSESGVSHNQYQEFNVDHRGVIFNNSGLNEEFHTEGGGVINIPGNKNIFINRDAERQNSYTTNTANVILNEVIGNNSSTLAGHQKIKGSSADYILANVNGIICDGCTFAPEFKNVTLAVGTPVIDNGEIRSIKAIGNSTILSLNNTDKKTNIADVLTLIAPVINIDGAIHVKEEVSFIVGQNNVEINTGRLLKIDASDNLVKTIDGYYLGSIDANRINIVDTRMDNNVNLFSDIFGGEMIDVSVDNKLRLRGVGKIQEVSGRKVKLHGNSIDITRTLTDDEIEKLNINKTNAIDSTRIKGNHVSLYTKPHHSFGSMDSKNRIDLSGVAISGDERIYIKSNYINIDGSIRENSGVLADYEHKQFFGSLGTKHSAGWDKSTLTYSTIFSENDIILNGVNDLSLKGVSIKSDNNITLLSEGDIHLNGGKETYKEKSEIKYSHYDNDAKTGHDKFEILQETFKPLYIKSKGGVKIESEKAVRSHGAKIEADEELSINGRNGVYIGVAHMLNSREDRKAYSQHLGIYGSEKDNKKEYYYVANKSELTGKKVIIHSGNDVEILAGKVNSLDGSTIMAQGDLTIDGVINKRSFWRDQETGVIFDITGSAITADNKYEKFIDTELNSGDSIFLRSNKNIYIDGSQLNAVGDFSIDADGEIIVQAARQQQKIDEEKTRLNMEWFSKEQGDKQYRAGFLIKHQKDSENSDKTEHQIATLNGKQINVNSGDNITFFGTRISTTNGDFKLKTEKNVGFFTAKNRAVINKEQTVNSGGFYYTGGIDKIGNGIQYTHVDSESHSDVENNLVVMSNINGNLNVEAGGDITQQGAQHDVAKKYYTRATNINNMASHNVDILKSKKLQVDAGLGFNVDYSGFTRPIEKSIKNPADSLNFIGGVGSKKGITDPNAGVDITASGSNTNMSNHNSLALVTTIKAQHINIEAKKNVLDEGTQYHATDGAIKLNADRHFSNAAVNTEKGTSQQEKGGAGMRVSTTTGQDIKVTLSAKAETSQGDMYAERMLPTYIQASNGVNITTTDDAYYNATQIEGGAGSVNIKAGNNLYFDQISDSHRTYNTMTSGNGKLSIGSTSGSKDFRLEGGGRHQQERSRRAEARVSKIKTRGDVILTAGTDLTTKGMEIGSQEALVNSVALVGNGKINLLASVSDSADVNDAAFGDFRLGGKKADSSSSASDSGFIGGGAQVDKVDQSISNRQGGIIYSENEVSIQSGSDSDQAIHMQGLQIDADKVDVDATHGGVFIESALSELPKENWGFGANLDLVLNRTTGKSDNGTVDRDKINKNHYVGSGVKVNVDIQDVAQHDNTRINTGQFYLHTKKDAVMKGVRIEAGQASVDVGGDFTIESVKSREDSVKVDVDLALSHTNDEGSSVVSSVSKLGTKRFEKDIKGTLNESIKKGELMYNKVSSPKDTMGGVAFNKESGRAQLPTLSTETKSRNFADKTARYVGREFKGIVSDPAGLQGHVKLDVKVVNNDAVAEQSGIFGTEEVAISVQGTTKLHGAEISSTFNDVILNIHEQELSSIDNSYHNGGGGFNLSASVLGNILGGTQDGIEGKSPFVNEVPYVNTREDKSVGRFVDRKFLERPLPKIQ